MAFLTTVSALTLLLEVHGVFYDRRSLGLTTFPTAGIDKDVSLLDVSSNRISSVCCLEPFPALVNLKLADNALEEFPDLTNVGGTLAKLHLQGNNIAYINPAFLNGLTALVQLNLNDNTALTTIPDVPGPGHTLVDLSMSRLSFTEFPSLQKLGPNLGSLFLDGNSIESFTFRDLEPLKKLGSLYLSFNPLKVVPNLCRIDNSLRPSNVLDLITALVIIPCGTNVYWMRLSQINNHIALPNSIYCNDPKLVWDSLDAIALLDKGANGAEFPEIVFEKLADPASFGCFPTVSRDVIANETVIGCGRRCLQEAACTMFAVDAGNCVLTEQDAKGPGAAADFKLYSEWYLVSF